MGFYPKFGLDVTHTARKYGNCYYSHTEAFCGAQCGLRFLRCLTGGAGVSAPLHGQELVWSELLLVSNEGEPRLSYQLSQIRDRREEEGV